MSKGFNKRKDALQNFSDKVISYLEQSENDKKPVWVRPWRTIDSKYRNAFSNRKYRGLHNILVCSLSGFTDPRYLTFNQVRKNKGKVKKGSKATQLIAWNFKKINEEQEDGSRKEKTIPFSRIISVFNVEQTEGLDLPELDTNILNEDLKPNDQVLDIFQKLNVNVENKKSDSAWYSPKNDQIRLPLVQQFTNEDDWAATALHELVHWSAKRVGRDASKYSFDISERAMEELVAELGSMYLCMNLKINGLENENSLSYISEWKKAIRGPKGKSFMYKACKLAEESAHYILKNSNLLEETEEESNE